MAQEHLITAATQLAMAHLYPRIFEARRNGLTMVATCVGDELHEVGMRMVADLFELGGWRTHFLGANTPPAAVADMVRDVDPDLVAVSATVLSNVEQAAGMVETIRCATSAPILVGGRAFLLVPDLWKAVGADATAADAASAVEVGAGLCRG